MLGLTLLSSPLNYSVDMSNARMLQGDLTNVLKVPVVVMVHQFNQESTDRFAEDVQRALDAKQGIVPIVIDSYGGSIYSFLKMADIIQSLNVPVMTVCVSKCMSAGILLLAMGTKGYRYSAPNATLLIHDASGETSGKVPDIMNDAHEIERLNFLIFSLLSKQTGHTADFYLKKLKNISNVDWYLRAEEAKELNIVNHVKMPKLKLTVETKVSIE